MRRIILPENIGYVSEILLFNENIALALCEGDDDGSSWEYFNPITGDRIDSPENGLYGKREKTW